MTKPLLSPASSSSSPSPLTSPGPSSRSSSSPASSASFFGAAFLAAVFFAAVFLAGAAFLAAVFFAAVFLAGAAFLAAVFFAAVFLAGAAFLAAVFFAVAFFAAGSVPGSWARASAGSGSTVSAAGAAAASVRAAVVFAATVFVAVRLAGVFAATLLRVVRLGDSAALTISVTPSSSRIWLRLRRTFFHWVAGIWSASKARRTSSPAICPSALPRSMSAITDSESAISGGSVRDVLADTNNLSERWKRLPTPGRVVLDRSRRPPTGDGPGARAGAGELHSTRKGCCLPSVGHHLSRSSRDLAERYARIFVARVTPRGPRCRSRRHPPGWDAVGRG